MYFSGYLVAIERTKTWGVSPFFFFSGFWERAWSDMPVLKEVSSVVDPEKVWLCSKMEHDYSTIICFGRWGSMLHGTIFRQQLSLLLGIAATPAECHR
jgi:hypothetical protein